MMRARELPDQERERAADLGITAIRAFFGSRGGDLESDAEFLERHLKSILKRAGYSSLSVSARPKKLSSAVDKIRRKCADPKSDYAARLLNGDPPQRIMTDLVGARITCKFSDQIDPIETLLKANYNLRDADRVDYRKPKEYNHFGYAALHLIAEAIEASQTKVYYSGCAFEVQVRSALMDIWSVVNWDVAYTEESAIPYEVNRRLSTLSALFYLVDQEFIRIRTETSAESLNRLPATAPLELSESLTTALAKRSINISEFDSDQLAEALTQAKHYFSCDPVLANQISADVAPAV